jgi:hypothetical protein
MRKWRTIAAIVLLIGAATRAESRELEVVAPPSLAAVAARVRAIDRTQLQARLGEAGLDLPPVIRVTLIDESDPRARMTPPWIVGLAAEREDIVIFPARVGSYPYDSLETVLRHEVVHLALSARAGNGSLPRWFHEGVAVSVETGWTLASDLQLLLGAADDPGIADLTRLFASDTHLGNAEAYRLATALVTDVRERHGATAPGEIAAQVARGVPFERAFAVVTGETPDAAAARAWGQYRRWTAWLPVITSGSAVWTAILVLAFAAFIAQSRRRARRRLQWEAEEELPRD